MSNALFSQNAHAFQGFSLKQVRACLRLEPLSLKLDGSRCCLAYGLPCGLLYVLLYDLLYGLPRDLLYGPAAVNKQPVQPVQPGKKSATLTPSHFTGIFPLQRPFPIRFYIKKRSPHKFMSNALLRARQALKEFTFGDSEGELLHFRRLDDGRPQRSTGIQESTLIYL